MHLNQTWQCLEGRQRTRTKCINLIYVKFEEILVTCTPFFLREGSLSSSSRLEIFAVNIGSATDLSVLRWTIFTFFHFCKNKTSLLCKNKAEVWTYLSVMQSISSTFGNLLSITFAAAMIFSIISSTFIPVWPMRVVLKEEINNNSIWAKKLISSYLFSLGIPKNAKSPLICNYHKGGMAIAKIFCGNIRRDSPVFIFLYLDMQLPSDITKHFYQFRSFQIHNVWKKSY